MVIDTTIIVSRVQQAAAQEVRRQADAGSGSTYLDGFVTGKDTQPIREDIIAAISDLGSAISPASIQSAEEGNTLISIMFDDVFAVLNNVSAITKAIEDYVANYCCARWLELHGGGEVAVKRYDTMCANTYNKLPRLVAHHLYDRNTHAE